MAKKFFTSIWFIWFAAYILLITVVGVYMGNIPGVWRALLLYPWSFLMGVLAYRRAAQHSVHPPDGGRSQSDNESKPATISG